MSGLRGAGRAAAATPLTASLGAVALSASAEADDVQRARRARRDSVLDKPLGMHGFHADVQAGGEWRPDEARRPRAASACSQPRKASTGGRTAWRTG